MGAHPLYASACVGYVGLVAHSQNIGIGIGRLDASTALTHFLLPREKKIEHYCVTVR